MFCKWYLFHFSAALYFSQNGPVSLRKCHYYNQISFLTMFSYFCASSFKGHESLNMSELLKSKTGNYTHMLPNVLWRNTVLIRVAREIADLKSLSFSFEDCFMYILFIHVCMHVILLKLPILVAITIWHFPTTIWFLVF